MFQNCVQHKARQLRRRDAVRALPKIAQFDIRQGHCRCLPIEHRHAQVQFGAAQNKLVEPLYELEKAGKLSNELEKTDRTKSHPGPVDPEGRAFVEGQLLKGGEMLASVWSTAWHNAPPDTFLRAQLIKRQLATSTPAEK